jgi:hypothetical protein
MRRPTYRRAAAKRRGPDRRIIAAVAVLVAFGGVIGITQISNADTSKTAACQAPAAEPSAATGKKAGTDPRVGTYIDKDGDLQHKGDGQLAKGEKATAPEPLRECKDGDTTVKQVNGLEILANSCDDSRLEPHDGFQNGNRCVSTEFGEVGEAAKNPSLLITEYPKTVRAGEPFTLKVSTRNLVRDRFLAAGQGGYYVESSLLTADGLVRGHFHTACRMLSSTDEAVDPAPVPAFFVATEDKKGGAEPDTVTIRVPGLPEAGIAQCASWAGDGSHRIPMMQRANQTPALDAVRVKVEGGDEPADPPADDPTTPPADNPTTPPADNPTTPPADNPTTPPADNGGNNGGGNNGGGNNGNNGGNGNGGNNGGDQGDDGATPSTTPPRTETGTTPPKTGTVTIPPTSGAKPSPTKTSKPAAPRDDDSADDNGGDKNASGDNSAGDNSDDDSAQAVTGRTTKPAATKTTEPAAEVVSDDDGAPDPEQPAAVADVQTGNKSKLALTGANSMTIILGGALLIVCGLVILGATRRRRAAERD